MISSPGRFKKWCIESWVKRLFDVLFSSLVLIMLSPLFVMVGSLIFMHLGSPIFFRQRRPGLSEKLFYMVKFRTMRNLYDPEGNLLQDKERLTRLGNILRKLSIDELPQFWNVIRGDMSIVGPRPLLMKYLDRYTKEQARRNEVRPGITGWAQVNGRNDMTWEEKFKLDVWYVDNRSLWLDLMIIAMTMEKVVKRKGICQQGYATMSEFKGSSAD